MLYRSYLIENGRAYVAIDLSCTDDDDARRQTASRDIEVWDGDRRVEIKEKTSTRTFLAMRDG
jgi:hypothetical protein